MRRRNKIAASIFVLFVLLMPAALSTQAKPSEYDQIVKHLKTKYQAKKVKIPFLWLARFAVSVVRPAGVKSFSVTLFENLKFSPDTLDQEMQQALGRSFAEEWQPVFRARSREGQQAYMYMREAGKDIRLTLVTIDKAQAAIVRATFSPDKLVEFTKDPKIFGISIGDKKDQQPPSPKVDPPPAGTSQSN